VTDRFRCILIFFNSFAVFANGLKHFDARQAAMAWNASAKTKGEGQTLDRKFLLHIFSFILLAISIVGCTKATLTPQELLSVNPSSALVVPGQQITFIATGFSGSIQDPVWMVNGSAGGSEATGTISGGLYTAPATLPSSPVQVTVKNGTSGATSAIPATVSFFSPSNFKPGTIASTNNPLVASYAVTVPQGSTVQVNFGTTTAYGLSTWAQKAPDGGGAATVLVAGMRASTTYHMQGTITLATGKIITDADKTFTTPAITAGPLPNISIPNPAGPNTAPGVEMIDIVIQGGFTTTLQAVVTDLSGNAIWYYPLESGETPFPIKLLPNGHMLLNTNGTSNTTREIDLAGNVLYEVTVDQLNQSLAKLNAGFDLQIFHHDVQKLDNGHYLILTSYTKQVTDTPGFSSVIGDVIIDWDPKANGIAWYWNTFDHLNLTHDPMGPNDWTHSNALVYSPDDGNIMLSMRNQNWVIKINYQDGAGDGSILWHFGPGGDFKLPTGEDPVEWNYAQHFPSFLSPNTAGNFQLMMFNNGNNRVLNSANQVCGTAGAGACYSSVPVYNVSESAKTANVASELILSPAYSVCCGNAEFLSNGNLEYDVAFDANTPNMSYIEESVPGPTPNLVWRMNIAGNIVYRGFRMPSLYPGVTWTQDAIAAANAPAVAKKTAP
jgi:arylsulfate sulfotransferase